MPAATTTFRRFVIATGICVVTISSALAQNLVSVKGSTLNMRSGPGTHTEVLWELRRGYPLRVLKSQARWLQVKDFEGDTGWVARSLVGNTAHHVVKRSTANVRSGPGTQYGVIGKAEYGELLRTLEKRGRWVRVERKDTKSGWISKSLLWGW
ncbi:SH3 domain-containing protein [Hydrogenophaga sp.]|uniref:SH3 domain-containing protein n=1 Tax=Hydrogenophaga sp. TaxID=1904254 RepID=UPI003AF626DC